MFNQAPLHWIGPGFWAGERGCKAAMDKQHLTEPRNIHSGGQERAKSWKMDGDSR